MNTLTSTFMYFLKMTVAGLIVGIVASMTSSQDSDGQSGAFVNYGMVLPRVANESSFSPNVVPIGNWPWVMNLDNGWIYFGTPTGGPNIPYTKLMPFNKRLKYTTAFIMDTNSYQLDINPDIVRTHTQPIVLTGNITGTGTDTINTTIPNGTITTNMLSPTPIAASKGGTGLTTSGTITGMVLGSDGAGNFQMVSVSSLETDPIWSGVASLYRTKTQNDLLYQPLGSYIVTEVDPTVPAYAKTLGNFSVIKASTDPLYEPVFTKNTAFNKNFGTTSGTVAEGNDSRINNGQTAFGWGNHAGLYPLYNGTGATGTWNISILGNSGTVTNGIYTTGSYSNPPWINSLASSKITGLATVATSGSYLDLSNKPTIPNTNIGSSKSGNTVTLTSSTGTGTDISIADADSSATNEIELPSQSGNSGKILTTNGSTPSWSNFKLSIPYTGTTNASGIYTIIYSSAYSTTPNVQVNLIGGTNKETWVVTSTTIGFSILVQSRVDVLGLLPTYNLVSGRIVNVLVTEN